MVTNVKVASGFDVIVIVGIVLATENVVVKKIAGAAA